MALCRQGLDVMQVVAPVLACKRSYHLIWPLLFPMADSLMASRFPVGKFVVTLLAGCLAACAAPVRQSSSPTVQSQEAESPAEVGGASRSLPYLPEDLPKIELSDELLIRMLVGDVAAQRGEHSLAYQAWFAVAEKTRDPRAARRAVEIAVANAQFDGALAAARLWVQFAPKASLPRQLLVHLLIRANQIKEAEPHLLVLLDLYPDELAQSLLQMQRIWPAGTDPEAIVQVYQALVQRYPDRPEAHYALAVELARQQKVSAAIAALDAALKLRPNWDLAALYKAQLLDAAERIAYLGKLSPELRQSRPALLLLASALLETNKGADARKIYDSVLARWPNDVEALTGAGLLAQYAGEYERSDRLLKTALEQSPANADHLRAYLGQSAEMRLQYREALAWYQQIGPNASLKITARIARLQAKLGARDEALQTVAALPEASAAEKGEKIQARAQVLRELKDYQGALKVLNEAVAAQPEAYDLLLERSLVADYTGDHALVESDLRRYLAKFPDDASALNALGYTLVNRFGRLVEAEGLIDRAIQSDPDNPAYIDSLGWLRYRQGRLAEARDLLARAHARFPDPEVSAHYAEVLWQSGDRAKARSILEAAIKLSPDDDGLLALKKKLGL